MKKMLTFVFALTVFTCFAQDDNSQDAVRLSAFDVSANNNTSTLHWKTICKLQYANFQVQRSEDGITYHTIHNFTADKLRCQDPFYFEDYLLSNTGDVYYRLNVGNIDGVFYNSAVRKVTAISKQFNLVNVYPTITQHAIHFSITNNENEKFSAAIYNVNGVLLKKQNQIASKGLTYFDFTVDNLPAGSYILQVVNQKGDVRTAKFMKL